MNAFKTAAEKVAREMNGLGVDQEAAFDPTMIFVIADVIFNLLDRCRAYRDGEEDMHHSMQRIGWLERRAIKMSVIDKMGRRNYRRGNGREMVEAIVHAAENSELQEVQALYDEMDIM